MNKRTVLLLVVSLVILTGLCVGLVRLCRGCGQVPGGEPAGSDQSSEQTEPAGNNQAAGLEDISVELGHGMRLVNAGAYTGVYMEDGSDEVVSGVLMLVITNTGEDAIEYAQITVPTDAGDALFSVSTLMPGASVVLLEQNRMAYTGQENYAQAKADLVAVFKDHLSLHADQLQIQILDGAINVTNISGQDIAEEILIYYKNSAADLYYGGITYRVRIEGGLKAGEIRQIMANHFSDSSSEIMFVTIG